MKNFEGLQLNRGESMDMRKRSVRKLIPEHELLPQYTRSSGPGGQHRNKVETAVRLRWSPEWNHNLSQEERRRIDERLRNEKDMMERLQRSKKQRFDYQYTDNVEEGRLLITAHEERDQTKNWKIAVEKFYDLLEEALKEDPERKPSKIPQKAKRRRLEQKKRVAEKKQLRRRPRLEDF